MKEKGISRRLVLTESEAGASIQELGEFVSHILNRVPGHVPAGTHGRARLSPRYLRRKPGRGLAIVYAAPQPVIVTVREEALAGSRIRHPLGQVEIAGAEFGPPGTLTTRFGIAVHVFPADDGLPGLASAIAPSPGEPAFAALQKAARTQLNDSAWNLASAEAEAVRYKPSSRCVIRYRLSLVKAVAEGTVRNDVALFGKVYADREQARKVHALATALYREQAEAGQPFVPRPLGIEDGLGLTLSEAIEPAETGLRAFGCARNAEPPEPELRSAALALARLHASGVRPAGSPRTGINEAKRVTERAQLIAGRCPEQSETILRVGRALAGKLQELHPETYLPAHGGFKPSQVLFKTDRAFLVDLDGFCLADPALDVGYFLAYLRPSGFWQGRGTARSWFEHAAAVFVDAYGAAFRHRNSGEGAAALAVQRSRLYAAALIFKIAARRAHRLNSPRSGELQRMLEEVVQLMS